MNNKKELLNNLREQIDSLDSQIIYLLFRRFITVKEIGNLKKEIGMEILQKSR